MPKLVKFTKRPDGYRFQGSYEIAALLSTQLNTPATQSTVNHHIFTVDFPESMYTRAVGALGSLGVEEIEVFIPLKLTTNFV